MPKIKIVSMEELRKSWKEQIEHIGLKRAVKTRLDEIDSATRDLPYLTHRAIQENMDEILELIDISEDGDF
jgi:oligoribonuclease (3'-5' exoribonuclease)